MRTAITTAQTHSGEELILHGRGIPVSEQLSSFRKLLGEKSHKKFKTISYQENDGAIRTLNFRSEKEQEKYEEARNRDERAFNKQEKAHQKTIEETQPENPVEEEEKKSPEKEKHHHKK